ncbi:ABC transporter ATP-binding protein [Wenzhouxiangella marina]|uniref:Oligopeptide/dipeptide ABC transporter, ATP-binding, C-terminal domain protein n=1 Tax=Wenzhouxiangella marina TaxID=1579979 RepID=A0A0K0XS30_9GAMM|nr:oligopeptide/dipeptide ABC transporter ATP-binding protein [Wenzhouxiangella marina]AKS40519.1 Oligopeptide/dipeptide ABC transporter, ATP-binding, C-terminal domain protein [Wenzhouxiangella marina]MBB6088159.1 oligopeptide transport system ATP-binding protein [Wenzhouxiangella marina]
MNARAPVLEVRDLSVHFRVDTGRLFRHDYHTVKAVDGVSFDVNAAETLGIVGESGCGKSTLARAILGLVKPQGGRVAWLGKDLLGLDEEAMRAKRREIQLIFQDPSGSLDPRMTVGDIVAEPLRTFYPSMSRLQVRERVQGMLKLVGLLPDQINRYPHEFSGGQCQRIGIARALVVNPRLVVCDEPVSALDVSIQAQIVNLLKSLQKKLQLSLIFIAHDLSVVRHVSDRVLVMYLGRVMEVADRDRIYLEPRHPYTRALIESVPIPDPVKERERARRSLKGDMPSPLDPPSGCVFRTRCPVAIPACAEKVPGLETLDSGRQVACIRHRELREELAPPEASQETSGSGAG